MLGIVNGGGPPLIAPRWSLVAGRWSLVAGRGGTGKQKDLLNDTEFKPCIDLPQYIPILPGCFLLFQCQIPVTWLYKQ